jgi:hypothetical protein
MMTEATSIGTVRRALALGWTGPHAAMARIGLANDHSHMIATCAVHARRYLAAPVKRRMTATERLER